MEISINQMEGRPAEGTMSPATKAQKLEQLVVGQVRDRWGTVLVEDSVEYARTRTGDEAAARNFTGCFMCRCKACCGYEFVHSIPGCCCNYNVECCCKDCLWTPWCVCGIPLVLWWPCHIAYPRESNAWVAARRLQDSKAIYRGHAVLGRDYAMVPVDVERGTLAVYAANYWEMCKNANGIYCCRKPRKLRLEDLPLWYWVRIC